MPQFQFTAADAKGEQISGTIESANEAEAIQQLRAQNYYPLQVVEAGKGKLAATKKPAAKKGKSSAGKGSKATTGGRIKPKVLMIFTRQLATLIDSGLPLLRGLTVLGKQEPNPVLQGTIGALADSVQGGSTFSEALAQHPKIFNKLYVNMVKAGELGGVLEVVLVRLAEYQEKAHKLKNKIVSAMVYPVIVMFIAVAILVFLMLFIVPKFEAMFADMGPGADLPLISRVVFGTSKFFLQPSIGIIPNIVWVFLLAVLVGVLGNAWGKTVKGRRSIDIAKLKLPIFGDIQRKSAIARFSRTLGTLVTSGVPILQALNITRDTAGNVVVSDAIDRVHEAVKEGESIVSPMQTSPVFPSMVISMVDVGEETGQLPEMLLKVADVYDDEVDSAVTALTSILEPIMIVVLALVVGAVVFALFLPLIKIISEMGDQ
ncbi:MAG: type II secretion system F family protein [Verrucomicrobia bacterium]|nr:MAG: type II secretion system F family protein [Verrucomicrobiota bacterium]TAE89129.1 MAG: type II secretion system F family protein [Verrucomicrobiota bacterium]TAF27997.1 MAG: type II secretion system F family protein [Verrucomicrobiota bacterium]TAF42844.1 MAG: type II secretion system F family protein [Verrucomicrobiota bacterium]